MGFGPSIWVMSDDSPSNGGPSRGFAGPRRRCPGAGKAHEAAAVPRGTVPRCTGRPRPRRNHPQTDAIAVEGVTISIASGCPAVAGVVHAMPKDTILTAKWPTCGVLRGVKLKALIVSQCTTIRGTLKARHHRPIPFVAKRSVCGDGILDPGNGEQCEPPNTATCDSH